jgi:hypothetical protein
VSAAASAAPYEIRDLGPGDAAAMLEVNRACHIEADLSLRFDREPDVLRWPSTVFDAFHYSGAFAGGRLVAYGMVGYRRGELGGRRGLWGYVGDFRVLPAHRGRSLVSRLGDALAGRAPPGMGLWVILVQRGNRAAERARGGYVPAPGLSSMPLADLDVVNLPSWVRCRTRGAAAVEPLAPEACEEVARFVAASVADRLLAPEVTPALLRPYAAVASGSGTRWGWVARAGGRVVGALLATDTYACRQVTIVRYGAATLPLRALWRAVRLARPVVSPLPPPGGALRGLTVTLLAADGRDRDVARLLLGRAAREALRRGLHLVHVGFAGDDPLRGAVRGWPRSLFRSRLHAVVPHESLGPVRAALARPPLFDLELA